MKRLVLSSCVVLSCSFLAISCNSGSGLVEKSSSSSTSTTGTTGGEKGTETSTSTTSTTGTPVATTTTGTTGSTPKPGGFNPNRSYQLADLKKATCTVNGHTFHLWVMDTQDKQMEGMMHLKNEDFKDDDGMMFVFPDEAPRKFWMHDTLIDLDITYCGKDGTINSTYTMKALDEKTDYSSKKPSQFVIELRAGILNKLGIKPGNKWTIPSDVVAQ